LISGPAWAEQLRLASSSVRSRGQLARARNRREPAPLCPRPCSARLGRSRVSSMRPWSTPTCRHLETLVRRRRRLVLGHRLSRARVVAVAILFIALLRPTGSSRRDPSEGGRAPAGAGGGYPEGASTRTSRAAPPVCSPATIRWPTRDRALLERCTDRSASARRSFSISTPQSRRRHVLVFGKGRRTVRTVGRSAAHVAVGPNLRDGRLVHGATRSAADRARRTATPWC